jgi:hypothetical protein
MLYFLSSFSLALVPCIHHNDISVFFVFRKKLRRMKYMRKLAYDDDDARDDGFIVAS